MVVAFLVAMLLVVLLLWLGVVASSQRSLFLSGGAGASAGVVGGGEPRVVPSQYEGMGCEEGRPGGRITPEGVAGTARRGHPGAI